MKNKKTTFLLLITCVIIFTHCKKKDKSSSNSNSTSTTTGPVAHVNTMTAKVNNVNWSMATEQGYSAYAISKFSNYFNFSGQTSFNNPYTSIQFGFIYGTGVFNFGSAYSNYYAQYKDSSNTNYTARTGTINISLLDTLPSNQGIINKFKATFSFVTDTINNKFYTITNGVVDFEKVN